MKKAYRILAILLCLSMLFALAACSAKQENTTEDQKPDETATLSVCALRKASS